MIIFIYLFINFGHYTFYYFYLFISWLTRMLKWLRQKYLIFIEKINDSKSFRDILETPHVYSNKFLISIKSIIVTYARTFLFFL